MTRITIALASSILITLACGQPAPPAEDPETVAEPTALEEGAFDAEIGGRTIHYEVRGNGPAVMVVTNSWGVTIPGLRGMLGGLEDRLTMIYFDPRGLGGSSPITEDSDMSMAAVREDFDRLRQHLGLDSVNAIGWSNGATNLILLAAERPETIDAAVFVHGAASFGAQDMTLMAQRYPEFAEMYMAFTREMADESVSDEIKTVRMREMWLEEYFPMVTGDPESAAPAIAEAFAESQFNWPHARHANSEHPTGFDYRERLGAISARSLVIAGAHDSLPPERVREIADGIEGASFVVFDGSGHFAPLEEPELFTKEVFGFLRVADTTSP
jgi:pimeloyl-ACP methyl ester carboxylesterase